MYRYILEKGSKKHSCPSCRKKTYVRYIDIETGGYLAYEYGRCDREINCRYFNKYYPNRNTTSTGNQTYMPREVVKLHSYHDPKLVKESMSKKLKNSFVDYLNTTFGQERVRKVVSSYMLGTAPYWYNGVIFWQIDQNNNVRGGKIIQYNSQGNRFNTPYWVHSYLKREKVLDDFNLGQCLFGLHLTNGNDNPIAIVESEKTACIMSLKYPKFLWLATGSLTELKKSKLLPIRERKIILYPDSGLGRGNKTPFELWSEKCDKLNSEGFDITISDLIEKVTTVEQKKKGYDIADFF